MNRSRFRGVQGEAPSQGANRWLIGLAWAAMLVCLVVFLTLTLVSEIDCDPDQLDTVQCDDERADGWGAVRGLLIFGIIGGLLVAGTFAMSNRAWTPIAAYAVLAPVAALAYFAIGGIEVSDRAEPELTSANLPAVSCFVSKEPRCEDGIPVEFTVSEPAEVVFSIGFEDVNDFKDRTFESSVVGEETDSGSRAYSFDAGSHEARVTTEVVRTGPLSPPGSLGTWPPGEYELLLSIEPDDSGTQATEDQKFEGVFVVQP